MPHGKAQDPLQRKWEWAKIQWEVAKETGVVDDSRRQLILPATVRNGRPGRTVDDEQSNKTP